jgi:uncharacterized membrane protein (UPF0127 family)
MKRTTPTNLLTFAVLTSLCLVPGISCNRQVPDLGTIEIKGETFTVELAYTPGSRAQGLMYRKNLPADRGMLFIFDRDAPRSFYMKNCLIDLDIIFFRSDGLIVNIHTMKAPTPGEKLVYYLSGAPVKYALELPAGTATRLNISRGERIDLPSDLARIKPQPDR